MTSPSQEDEHIGSIRKLRLALLARVDDWSGLDRALYEKLKTNLEALGVDTDNLEADIALKQLACLAGPMKILRDNQLHLAKIIQSLIQINTASLSSLGPEQAKPSDTGISALGAFGKDDLDKDDLVSQLANLFTELEAADWQDSARVDALESELDKDEDMPSKPKSNRQ